MTVDPKRKPLVCVTERGAYLLRIGALFDQARCVEVAQGVQVVGSSDVGADEQLSPDPLGDVLLRQWLARA